MPDRVRAVTPAGLQSLIAQLPLAVFVFRDERLIYSNQAATRLANRVRVVHNIELVVLLRHYLARWRETPVGGPDSFALTARDREPFLVHVIPLLGRYRDVATTVRQLGTELDGFQHRYGLSAREVQVIELVLRGYRNRDIAGNLGVAAATVKKHLSHIFDKVGVDSRSQLASRLA